MKKLSECKNLKYPDPTQKVPKKNIIWNCRKLVRCLVRLVGAKSVEETLNALYMELL